MSYHFVIHYNNFFLNIATTISTPVHFQNKTFFYVLDKKKKIGVKNGVCFLHIYIF